MKLRLGATICVALLLGTWPSVRAQSIQDKSLTGISTVAVLVEDLPDGAKVLGLSVDTIQTDVELKLRLAGMRVVTPDEAKKLPGSPYVYVQVTLTNSADAGDAMVQLSQNAMLESNNKFVAGVATWQVGGVFGHPTAQGIRDRIKDMVDQFLNAWLSVNPKT